jgi:protein-disulfide isomerase
MKSNAYIDGNKNSKFLIVEYTDPECPFCVRQFKDNTIKTVMESNKDVAHIVKVVQ